MKIVLLNFTFAILCGCQATGDAGNLSGQITENRLESEMDGIYQAVFAPVNKTVSGHLSGSLTIAREKDELVADIRISSGPLKAAHLQKIHIGGRCPEERDDLNGDGYLDAAEAAPIFQEVLIPLDDDLSSQWVGLGISPVADEYGGYFWARSTSFEKILNDLREEDINPSDELVKLAPGKPLSLMGKVAVIYGAGEEAVFPETVSGKGQLNAHAALPIACGVIRKITAVPGQVDRDETNLAIPAEGETIGGSSGIDDGAIFSQTQGGGSGGNYGDDDPPPMNRPKKSSRVGKFL